MSGNYNDEDYCTPPLERPGYIKPEIAKAWVAALRSGDYLPAQHKLRGEDDVESGKPRMCCLAVLADTIAKQKLLPDYALSWYKSDGGYWLRMSRPKDDTQDRNGQYIPSVMFRDLNVENRSVDLFIDHSTGRAYYSLNDASRDPNIFNQIADIIERDHINNKKDA